MTSVLDMFGENHKVETDKLGEPIIWARDAKDVLLILQTLREDDRFHIDYLTDLTAYDNGDGDFVLVVQLFSMESKRRVRIKLSLKDGEDAESLTGPYPAANWLEREVFDLYGIKFRGHPDLRRIMMDERFEGHPLRKSYGMKQRMPFSNNMPISLERSPYQCAPQTKKTEEKARTNLTDFYNPNVLINLGPSHPAMHGTLRVMCRLNGETIEDAKCELGFLHRAIEKLGEEKTYHQWMVYTDRLNYCSALNNNIAYAMAVENLMNIQITERCLWIRMVSMELSRIIDHIICVAINALDMGAMTIFWLFYHWREEAYTMIESMCGMRLTTSYARIGGMMYDLPDNFESRLKKFCDEFPKAVDEIEALLTGNRIWIDRTKGVGRLSAADALKLSATGPVLRASGVDFDLRRDRPYYAYSDVKFDVVVASNGDVYDRYLVRMEEMRQSVRILRQCLHHLSKTRGGPLWVDDKRVLIPEKQDVYSKMEVLIHHFKIFMEGIDVPPGEAYTAVEGPNGELGFYIVSRGGPKAWRMRIKSPSFVHFQLMENTLAGERIPDAVSILGSVNIIAGELDR